MSDAREPGRRNWRALVAVVVLLPLVIAFLGPPDGVGWIVLLLPLIVVARHPERLRRHALFGLGILLQVLAYPVVDWGFLGFFLLVPYLLAREQDDGAPWWRTAFLYGFVRAFVGYAWLGNIFYSHWISVSFLSGLTFACCFEGVLRKATFLPYGWRAATGWVLFEWVHSWIGGGFPWLYLAHTQHRNVIMIQMVDLAGTYALSFVLCYFQAAAARAWGARRFRELCAAALLLAAVWTYGVVRLPIKDVPTGRSVLLVQTAIPLELKLAPDFDPEEMLHDMRELSWRGLQKEPCDLVVWPETMHPWPYVVGMDRGFPLSVRSIAARLQRPVIYGANTYSSMEELRGHRGYNSAVLVDANGKIVSIYRKQLLVPLGEELLLRRFLPDSWVDPFTAWLMEMGYPANADLEAGKGHVTLDAGAGLKAALLICFEGLYSDVAREAVLEGDPDFLLCVANFGWFRASWEQPQSRAIWVFRAVETRTPFLCCANGGISCAFAPSGRPIAELPGVMTEGTLRVRLVERGEPPLFLRGGRWLLPGLLFFAAGVGLVWTYGRSGGVSKGSKDRLDSREAFC